MGRYHSNLKNMNRILFFIIICFVCFNSCQDEELTPMSDAGLLYFPLLNNKDWQTVDPQILNWNQSQIDVLKSFLNQSKTRAFLLLKDGKIAIEYYSGEKITGTGAFDQESNWYWASAGKSLTASLVGIAQQQSKLKIDESSNKYLGKNWSSLSPEQENQITIRHHLTMTSGLDDKVPDNDCTLKSCLQYKAISGSRWFYHNAPYTLLDGVISGATGEEFDSYFNNNLRDPIGMDGFWSYLDYNHVFFSTARSMARYGLLILNEGKWKDQDIISDKSYLTDMTSSSQNLNPSYGYLLWLNGKDSYIAPGFQTPIKSSLVPNAPGDMIIAAGKNGQFLCIVPSQNIIMVRMGENPDQSQVPIGFLNDLWAQLGKLIN